MTNTTNPEQLIDEALDSVLRASGSALGYYRTERELDRMRKAMHKIMSDSYIAGSNDAMKVMREYEKVLKDAIYAMVHDGWLDFGYEGMSSAQEKCLAAFNILNDEQDNKIG
jgi:hypothetical protein